MRVFTAEIFMKKDEIRDEEKTLAKKFGEPCVVLPPYIKPHNDKWKKMARQDRLTYGKWVAWTTVHRAFSGGRRGQSRRPSDY